MLLTLVWNDSMKYVAIWCFGGCTAGWCCLPHESTLQWWIIATEFLCSDSRLCCKADKVFNCLHTEAITRLDVKFLWRVTSDCFACHFWEQEVGSFEQNHKMNELFKFSWGCYTKTCKFFISCGNSNWPYYWPCVNCYRTKFWAKWQGHFRHEHC